MTCHELYPSGKLREVIDLATLYRKVRQHGASWVNVDGNVLTVRYGHDAGYHQSVWASAAVLLNTVTSPRRRAFAGLTARRAALPLFSTLPPLSDHASSAIPEPWGEYLTHFPLYKSETGLALYGGLYNPATFHIRIGMGRVIRLPGPYSDALALYHAFAVHV